jgi:hypothetical protein
VKVLARSIHSRVLFVITSLTIRVNMIVTLTVNWNMKCRGKIANRPAYSKV